jgi:uncharacterized protein GlcG (DUF336 family)
VPRCLAEICLAALLLGLAGCPGGSAPTTSTCSGHCTGTAARLTVADVENVISRGVAEAQARGVSATIAVVDRSGNVLAVFAMQGARATVTVDSGRNVSGGLEGIDIIPASLAAISKAITGAYLSSEGNAFSTRTASEIIQQHFAPGELGMPGGPLFGVQFSQLPCSDLNTRFNGSGVSVGPHRAPLGLAGDPGGFPLYRDGALLGGVGVMADGVYGIDRNIRDRDSNLDELVAMAAMGPLAPADDRRADRITVDGRSLRFSDVGPADLASDTSSPPAFSTLDGSAGQLLAVTGYTDASVHAGTVFGEPASGIRPDPAFAGEDAYVLVDDANQPKYPPIAGTDGLLTAGEVRTLLADALAVANHARAQIRRPLGSVARISIAVVDTHGVVLGILRSRDAPVFGIDVALQKARTAAFFSSAGAAADLQSLPPAQYQASGATSDIGAYVTRVRDFLGAPTALADGAFAFGDRAGGNLSRPFFPDGIDGNPNGPFSKAIGQWSAFSTGLQLDLVNNSLISHVGYVLGTGPDVAGDCTGIPRLANGIQVFPGSVPIYRGRTLVGGIGVSGDGVDQDDMVSFLGLDHAGNDLGTINNAPPDMRADRLAPMGVHLRFIQCPIAPFVDSDETDVCKNK